MRHGKVHRKLNRTRGASPRDVRQHVGRADQACQIVTTLRRRRSSPDSGERFTSARRAGWRCAVSDRRVRDVDQVKKLFDVRRPATRTARAATPASSGRLRYGDKAPMAVIDSSTATSMPRVSISAGEASEEAAA